MTNKPMLSVDRELLDRLVKGEPYSNWSALDDDRIQATEELRALLDKPVLKSWPCWSCKTHITLAERAEADGECPHCEAELDLDDWPIEPAAQHQGEAVALQHIAVSEGGVLRWMTGRKMQHCELYAMPDGSAIRSNLYAAQPAPVAVVLPERLNPAELDELEVIEVLLSSQGLSNLAGTMAAARQFIDEVNRLNGVKP